jgi:hypothetical protein
MGQHGSARLSVHSRLTIARRVIEEGWTVAEAARRPTLAGRDLIDQPDARLSRSVRRRSRSSSTTRGSPRSRRSMSSPSVTFASSSSRCSVCAISKRTWPPQSRARSPPCERCAGGGAEGGGHPLDQVPMPWSGSFRSDSDGTSGPVRSQAPNRLHYRGYPHFSDMARLLGKGLTSGRHLASDPLRPAPEWQLPDGGRRNGHSGVCAIALTSYRGRDPGRNGCHFGCHSVRPEPPRRVLPHPA